MKRYLLVTLVSCLSLVALAVKPSVTVVYDPNVSPRPTLSVTINGNANPEEVYTLRMKAFTLDGKTELPMNKVYTSDMQINSTSWKVQNGSTNYVWDIANEVPVIEDYQNVQVIPSLDSINVDFISNHGTISYTNRNYVVGSTYENLSTATSALYTFLGWYSSLAAKGTQFETTTIVSDAYSKFYAGWQINVTFNTKGGNVIAPRNYILDTSYGTLPAPERNGYEFSGWYDQEFGGSLIQTWDVVKTNCFTMYAHWNEYCIIDISGGTTAVSYPVSYTGEVPIAWIEEGITNREWTTPYKTTKIVLKKIETSNFVMGDANHSKRSYNVSLTKPYWIGLFEITQRQWQLVMGSRPSYFNPTKYYAERPVETISYEAIRGPNTPYRFPYNTEVASTSFVGRLRSKVSFGSGRGSWRIDLPTESQWENACRATTTTDFNDGTDYTGEMKDESMDVLGRYYYNSDRPIRRNVNTKIGTNTVGSYYDNKWNLFDMHGNVWEWCLDFYGEISHTNNQGKTATYIDPVGSYIGTNRVIRGGSWRYYAYDCASHVRYYSNPTNQSNNIGFRLSATLSD